MPEIVQEQEKTNQQNREFWNQVCGTTLAKEIGLPIAGYTEKELSRDILRRFDEAYFAFYPYYLSYFPFEQMAGKRVLEIGLGFGSVGQKLVEAGADYSGIDIAQNPVEILNLRMQLLGKASAARTGNALALDLPDNTFDYVISMGVLHHTGNLPQALREVYRVLKPGGTAILMLYNRHCYRYFQEMLVPYWKNWIRHLLFQDPLKDLRTRVRERYDRGNDGTAPETVLSTKAEIREMMASFSTLSFTLENCDKLKIPFKGQCIPRERLLSNFAHWLGLDIYIRATK